MLRQDYYQESEVESVNDITTFVLGRYNRHGGMQKALGFGYPVGRSESTASKPSPSPILNLESETRADSKPVEKEDDETNFVKDLNGIVKASSTSSNTRSDASGARGSVNEGEDISDLREDPRGREAASSQPSESSRRSETSSSFTTDGVSDVHREGFAEVKMHSAEFAPSLMEQATEEEYYYAMASNDARIPTKERGTRRQSESTQDIDLESEQPNEEQYQATISRRERVPLRQGSPNSLAQEPISDENAFYEFLGVPYGVLSTTKSIEKYPHPCPLCGANDGVVTQENLGIWALGAYHADLVFENETGFESFAELERFIKYRD